MKPTNQTTEDKSLTEFDKRMIKEMKKIPELQSWTDQQFAGYCSILKCYSLLIVSDAINDKLHSEESSSLMLSSTHLKQAA